MIRRRGSGPTEARPHRGIQRPLWFGAVVFYGLGDTVTTLLGVRADTVSEAGPIAGAALAAHGPLGFLGVKVALFLVLAGFWHWLETPGRVAIPLGLVVVGVLVTVWNLAVLMVAG